MIKGKKKQKPFHIGIRVRLFSGKLLVYGNGISELLTLTDRYSSLHKAAIEMGMSYRKALQIVKRAEEGFGQPILERSIGGAGGGGSQLNEFGKILVTRFSCLEKEMTQYAEEKIQNYFPEMKLECKNKG